MGPGDDGAGCLPRQVLHYARGERQFLAELSGAERKIILSQAPAVMERLRAGKIRGTEAIMRTGPSGPSAGSTARENQTVGPVEIGAMTTLELGELMDRVRARQRALAAGQRQVPKLERQLETRVARREALDQEIGRLKAQIKALQQGRVVEAKSRGGEESEGTARRLRGAWTPEQKLAAAERMIRTVAKKYGWSAERLKARLAEL